MQPIFPFEKNRYFAGKRMLSKDFSRELEYMDHKFQCLNRWAFGSGIAFGLEVQRLDSESLMVSQGMAIDRQGHYLIVDEPAVCRIKTITGYDDIHGDTAMLWLTYKEKESQPMVVITKDGEQKRNSVSTESYDLQLTEFCSQPLDTADQSIYFDAELYADDIVKVRQIMPLVISSQQPVNIRLIIENITAHHVNVDLHYEPQIPGFHMEGQQGICLDKPIELPKGDTIIDIKLLPETPAQSVLFSLKRENFRMRIASRNVILHDEIKKELKVVSEDPIKVISERLCDFSAQDLWGNTEQPGIPIAGIRLVKEKNDALISDIIPLYHHQRTHLPYIEQRIEKCRQFFPAPEQAPIQVVEPAVEEDKSKTENYRMTTGVVTIHADINRRKSKLLYSGEISHDLGPGPVYVDFGLENVMPSSQDGKNIHNVLLGDASLFMHSNEEYEYNFDRGVRVHPDKGTFELAVRLKGQHYDPILKLRWYAWQPKECLEPLEINDNLIRLDPDVIYVQPGEVIHFTPIFHQKSQPCEFFIPEKQSGLITQDGVYTAPEKKGLYQINARIQNLPESRTVSAYVIVEGQEEGAKDAGSTQ